MGHFFNRRTQYSLWEQSQIHVRLCQRIVRYPQVMASFTYQVNKKNERSPVGI